MLTVKCVYTRRYGIEMGRTFETDKYHVTIFDGECYKPVITHILGSYNEASLLFDLTLENLVCLYC